MIRAVLNFFLAVVLVACAATGPIFSPAQDFPEGYGVVYVYRQDQFVNKLIRPGITVDNHEYPALPSGGYLTFILKEGEHTVGLVLSKDYEGSSNAKVAVASGSTSYVRLTTFNEFPDSQTIRRVFLLDNVAAESAASEIKDCKLVDLKTGKRYSKSIFVDD